MRVLVTGGAGFIGSHVCERLLRESHQVSIIDDLNDFYAPELKMHNLACIKSAGEATFYRSDICDDVALSVRRIMLIANLPIRAALFWLLFIQCGFSPTARVQPAQQPSAGSTEQVRLCEILISTPKPYDAVQVDAARHRAEQVRSSIGRSGTFADVARANSQGPTAKQGGDLGCFTHGKLPPDLEDLVFRMRVGDVSEVVRTKQGFVILEANERGADC